MRSSKGCRYCARPRRPPLLPDLVDGIVERGRKMAAAGVPRPYVVTPAPLERPGEPGEEATAEPFVATTPSTAVPTKPEERGKWWWVPRAVAGAGAAAGIVAALAMSFQGFRALRGRRDRERRDGGRADCGQRRELPAGRARGRALGEERRTGGLRGLPHARRRVDAVGRSALRLAGRAGVRVPGDARAGPALDRGALAARDDRSGHDGPPRGVPDVWQSKTDPEIVFLRTPRRPRRTSRSAASPGRAGERPTCCTRRRSSTGYGLWPALPSRFATPEAGDGSPTFIDGRQGRLGARGLRPARRDGRRRASPSPRHALERPGRRRTRTGRGGYRSSARLDDQHRVAERQEPVALLRAPSRYARMTSSRPANARRAAAASNAGRGSS